MPISQEILQEGALELINICHRDPDNNTHVYFEGFLEHFGTYYKSGEV